eukprot:163745_1
MSSVCKVEKLLADAIGYQSHNQHYFAGSPLQECKRIVKCEQIGIPSHLHFRFYQAYSEYKLWKFKIQSALKYYGMSLKYLKNKRKSNEKKVIENRFFSQLSKCYYRHGHYEGVIWVNKHMNIFHAIPFDHWIILFETSFIYKNINQMMHYLKIIQKKILNKDQEQMYLQYTLKYEIACTLSLPLPTPVRKPFIGPKNRHEYYQFLRTKWWKENSDPNIGNPYYYLFYCYLSLLLGKSGIYIDEIHIRNFILVDSYTTVQLANIITKVDGFQALAIYSEIYCSRPKYVINLFHFGMFCLKFDHLIFAKKLFQKARHTSYKCLSEKIKKMIQQINIQLTQKKCDNIYCSKNSKKLKVCSGCGNTYYCDRKCQSMSWEMHSKLCDNKWEECYERYKNAEWSSNMFPPTLMLL